MRVNNSTTDLTINSTLDRADLRRLTASPYDNMIYVEVTEKVGSQTLKRGRYITMSHQSCFREQNLSANPTTTQASSNSIGYLNNETNNFQVREISGPFMQIGNERICNLPDNTANTLSCPAEVIGPGNRIRMIYGGQDTFGAGKSARNLFYLWLDNDPDGNPLTNDAGYRLHLYSKFSEGNLTINQNTVPIPDLNLNDPFYIEVFAPSPSDAMRHYKAIVVYRDRSDDQVHLSYVRWNKNGLENAGMFNNGSLRAVNPLGPSPNVWAADPADPAFTINRITYHAPTHSIVAASNDTGRIYVRKLKPYLFENLLGSDNNLTPDDYVGGIKESTDPAAMSATNPGYALNQSLGNISFRELWVSQDGETVLAKTRLELGGNQQMHLVAFHPDLPISPENSSLNLSNNGNDNGNIALIMTFDQAIPTDTNGESIGNDSDRMRVWYNAYTGKFYWLVQGNSNDSSKFLFEWDPKTWGLASTTANQWVENGTSIQQQRSRIKILGQQGSTAASIYTGQFRTVRKLGGAPVINAANPGGYGTFGAAASISLWQDGDPVQITYNPKNQTYYISDGQSLHAVNLNTGYVANFNASQADTDNNGRKLLVHPKTGWLFYTSSESTPKGLYAYNPGNLEHSAILNTVDFSTDRHQGNGDLVFNPYTMQVYILNRPDTVDSSHRPQFIQYKPYCLDGAGYTSGNTASFTTFQQVNPLPDNTWYQTSSNNGSEYQWSQYSWSQAN